MTNHVITSQEPAYYHLPRCAPHRAPRRQANIGLMCLNLGTWVYALAATAHVLS
jgi:hypothetical protein